jgi:hypothetical protein
MNTKCFADKGSKCNALNSKDCFQCHFYKPITDKKNIDLIDKWSKSRGSKNGK